tara:strand:- start:15795 stop:17603 length:1809 start_codon:yes stop_codon:yes gene_type:complete
VAAKKAIYYIGSDIGYWDVIQKRMQQNYAVLDFAYFHEQVSAEKKYSDVFLDLVAVIPSIIYLDFSVNLKEQIQLARMIKRENSISEIPLIGLVDKKSEVRNCLAAGADVVHVKCGEYHDVIYDAVLLMDDKVAKPPVFARGKLAKEISISDDFRIGYITDKGIHAEGNLYLEEGQEIVVESAIPTSIVPSKRFKVSKVDQINLYYDSRYSYDLDFKFVDQVEIDVSDIELMIQSAETDEEKKKLEKKLIQEKAFKEREAQDLLVHVKKKVKDWVRKNTLDSVPKSTKLMIVDRSLAILSQIDRPLDSYPFALRMQTYLNKDVPEIRKIRPSIIAFQYLTIDTLALPPEELEEHQERIQQEREQSENQLQMIFDYLKSCSGYHPLVIIYNFPEKDSKEVQAQYQYPLTIVKGGLMAIDSLVQIGETYEKNEKIRSDKKLQDQIKALKAKDPVKYRALTPASFEQPRFYISKSHDLSYVSTQYKVTMVSLTESEVEISCDERLELKTYRLDFPISMSVRLIAQPDGKPCKDGEGGHKLYRGLIHSVGEEDKKEIRRYINEVFFSPLKEKREQEAAAFKELNEKKKLEKEALDSPVKEDSSEEE